MLPSEMGTSGDFPPLLGEETAGVLFLRGGIDPPRSARQLSDRRIITHYPMRSIAGDDFLWRALRLKIPAICSSDSYPALFSQKERLASSAKR